MSSCTANITNLGGVSVKNTLVFSGSGLIFPDDFFKLQDRIAELEKYIEKLQTKPTLSDKITPKL